LDWTAFAHVARYNAAMKESPIERDRVQQFEVVAVFGDAQLVKRLDGRLEILSGIDDDRRQAREWMETFTKPRTVPELMKSGKNSW
jgi:hypothetical protein